MRALVGVVALGALVAGGAWSAAMPPGAVDMGSSGVARVSPGPFPKLARDVLGRDIVLRAPPRRIVSIALSADEILLELVSPDRLAGVTYLIDDPATSLSSPNAPPAAARVTEQNPEAILALQPDLVVAAGYTRAEAIELLSAAGIAVLGSGGHASLADVLDAITALGAAVGEEERARQLVVALSLRIDAVTARTPRAKSPRVLVWEGGYTYGVGTLQDDLVRLAGATNAAADHGLRGPMAITEEGALALEPDVIVVPIDGTNVRLRAPELLGDAPIWSAMTAVRRGAVFGVPRTWIGSVSHHAVRALEALASIVAAEAP